MLARITHTKFNDVARKRPDKADRCVRYGGPGSRKHDPGIESHLGTFLSSQNQPVLRLSDQLRKRERVKPSADRRRSETSIP
jgi:hypothetical protein